MEGYKGEKKSEERVIKIVYVRSCSMVQLKATANIFIELENIPEATDRNEMIVACTPQTE